jgi:hypothetical protein
MTEEAKLVSWIEEEKLKSNCEGANIDRNAPA